MNPIYFDRDLSWLSFNGRVLEEASRTSVPLLERVKFLSIFSSNLDEFYRVRMPALAAIQRINVEGSIDVVNTTIHAQQERFGSILSSIIAEFRLRDIHIVHNEAIPAEITDDVRDYFYREIAGYITLNELDKKFFPENNKLYMLVVQKRQVAVYDYKVITIPTEIPRFMSVHQNGKQYILFIDDVIRQNLGGLFDQTRDTDSFTFKITRNAELDLKDEYAGNLAKKIEREIERRDFGLASRFLYQRGANVDHIEVLSKKLKLDSAAFVEGGTYHNLKDLATLPVQDAEVIYPPWRARNMALNSGRLLLDTLLEREILIHPPYHSYEPVVRFFNEAAVDRNVTHIYVTLYRVASSSRIASALCHAAKNGKKVMVFVELKARFDEANNIKWSKKMKASGVSIVSSIPELKVHAKIALIKRRVPEKKRYEYLGLLSTGNFNESTARFYTDHVFMTSSLSILKEVERLFKFLRKRKKPKSNDKLVFNHLLVAQFNLEPGFMKLIDREIDLARTGLAGRITVKLNNLEEPAFINKLYEASNAGVQINLIVRGICCLVPGIKDLSLNIRVIRIIDRYLEHGRVFLFGNNGDTEVYLGSADWMTRNIHRRIEVCFPISDSTMKQELMQLIDYQLRDNQQAVILTSDGETVPVHSAGSDAVRSQALISRFIDGTS